MNSATKIETVETSLGQVTLLGRLGKGKSGYSFLSWLNGRFVVLKRMHNEPCPYYTFPDNKVQMEVQAYQKLQQLGIPVPELLWFDAEQNCLVKEYIEGASGHHWLSWGEADESVIEQLFSISNRLRAHGLNIDYFPANFVIARGRLYYVDYEINPYSDAWSLDQWGIYYWANQAGMAEYARSRDWRGINENASSGIPIKAPFEEKVRKWKAKFQCN